MNGAEKIAAVESHAEELEVEIVLADGLEDAIVGVTDDFRAVYVVEDCIAVFESEGMTPCDALDFFYFNVAGAHVDSGPLFMTRVEDL